MLSLIAIIYGAIVALVQPDLKRLVAYSSVSHMGFVTLGLFVFTEQGVQGAILQMINHGLITGGLFLLVGVIYERTHDRTIAKMGGLAARMPVYAAVFGFFVFASAGLPGLSGFVGEFLTLVGTFEVSPLAAAIAAFVMVLAAGYLLYMYGRIVFGEVSDFLAGLGDHLTDMTPIEILTLVPLATLIVVFGIQPRAAARPRRRARSSTRSRPRRRGAAAPVGPEVVADRSSGSSSSGRRRPDRLSPCGRAVAEPAGRRGRAKAGPPIERPGPHHDRPAHRGRPDGRRGPHRRPASGPAARPVAIATALIGLGADGRRDARRSAATPRPRPSAARTRSTR